MQRSDTEERRELERDAERRPGSGDGMTGRERVAAGAGARPDDELEEISLLELGNVLLKRWKLVVGLPLVAAVVAAVISLIIPPRFTASAVFVPEQESGGVSLPAGLAGLASQFGVSIPGGAGGNSPRLYADVIESRSIRDEVLQARYPDPRGESPADSATLLDILEIEGDGQLERLEAGRKALAEMVSVRFNNETNVVNVSVETHYPQLSAAVANHILDLLNRFNLETRQSNARERRRFIEERLNAAGRELRGAEEALKGFLEQNRRFTGSPELTFQHDRLQRQVSAKQDVYTSLLRSYEEARIQEVNDTPVLTVIDRAVPPQEKSSPKRKLNVVLAFLLGGVLGVFGAFGREFVERARERDTEEYEEFTSRWAAIKAELRGMVRRRGGSGEE